MAFLTGQVNVVGRHYVLWLNVETGVGSTNPVWRWTFKKDYLVIYLFRSGLLFSRTRPIMKRKTCEKKYKLCYHANNVTSTCKQ